MQIHSFANSFFLENAHLGKLRLPLALIELKQNDNLNVFYY